MIDGDILVYMKMHIHNCINIYIYIKIILMYARYVCVNA